MIGRRIDMPSREDDHALLAWLHGKALEAHNAEAYSRNGESVEYDYGVFAGEESAFNEVIAYIEHGRKSQRPHVKERI